MAARRYALITLDARTLSSVNRRSRKHVSARSLTFDALSICPTQLNWLTCDCVCLVTDPADYQQEMCALTKTAIFSGQTNPHTHYCYDDLVQGSLPRGRTSSVLRERHQAGLKIPLSVTPVTVSSFGYHSHRHLLRYHTPLDTI